MKDEEIDCKGINEKHEKHGHDATESKYSKKEGAKTTNPCCGPADNGKN